jgi:hypothetical protein
MVGVEMNVCSNGVLKERAWGSGESYIMTMAINSITNGLSTLGWCKGPFAFGYENNDINQGSQKKH